MSKKLFIITGASRGLGQGLAKSVLDKEIDLVCVSRQLANLKTAKSVFKNYSLDLKERSLFESFFDQLKSDIDTNIYDEIILINNAGVLEPIQFFQESETQSVLYNLEVNILGTIAFTHVFLKFFADKNKIILTISSGAGKNSYCGWSSYCTSKSALDMFSRVLRDEIHHAKPKERCLVYSLSPGVIDTTMQDTIRTKDIADFPMVNKFLDLKNNDLLQSADVVGEKIITFCLKPNVELPCLININEI